MTAMFDERELGKARRGHVRKNQRKQLIILGDIDCSTVTIVYRLLSFFVPGSGKVSQTIRGLDC